LGVQSLKLDAWAFRNALHDSHPNSIRQFLSLDTVSCNYWMWANRAWIRSVMARQMWVYDIGRDGKKVMAARAQSELYSMELEETAAYPLKAKYPWPPSL